MKNKEKNRTQMTQITRIYTDKKSMNDTLIGTMIKGEDMKHTIIFVLLLMVGTTFAQGQLDTLPGFYCASGPRAVYVNWMGSPMSTWEPTPEGYIGFNVYRTEAGEKDFKRLNSQPVMIAESVGQMKALLGPRLKDWQKLLKERNAEGVYSRIREADPKLHPFATFDVNMMRALGLAYRDGEVELGKEYTYRITLIHEDGTETSPSGELSVVAGVPPRPLYGPLNLIGKAGDSKVTISWRPNPDDSMAILYNIYRSTEREGTYLKITPKPIAVLVTEEPKGSFIDDQVTNGLTYYYKVTSLDFLRNESPQVGPVEVTPRDMTPPPPPQEPKAEGSTRGIVLTWRLSKAPDVKGYWIYRAEEHDGDYQRLSTIPVPPDTGLYEDVGVPPNKEYYYKITALDYSGNESPASAPAHGVFLNYTPPLPPQNVKAEGGIKKVKISWSPNEEKDLKGYYVFRAFRPDGKYEQISPLIPKDTTGAGTSSVTFIDEDKILSALSTYFYAVTAVNNTGVSSPYSNVVAATVVDTVGPMQPLGFKGWWDEAGAHLLWDASMDNTVAGYAIYKAEGKTRSLKLQEDYTLLTENPLRAGTKSFTDRDVERGVTYTYRLVAINRLGVIGEPSPPVVVYTAGVEANPPGLVRLVKQKDGIMIKWNVTREQGVTGYRIYKSLGGGEYQLLKELSVDKSSWVDKNVTKGELYYYYVTCTSGDGKEGLPSRRVSITY